MDLIKIKNFCSTKDPIKKVERQSENWEKIFANDIANERLTLRLHKELLKFNSKTHTYNPLRKWVKDVKRHFRKEYIEDRICLRKDIPHH